MWRRGRWHFRIMAEPGDKRQTPSATPECCRPDRRIQSGKATHAPAPAPRRYLLPWCAGHSGDLANKMLLHIASYNGRTRDQQHQIRSILQQETDTACCRDDGEAKVLCQSERAASQILTAFVAASEPLLDLLRAIRNMIGGTGPAGYG